MIFGQEYLNSEVHPVSTFAHKQDLSDEYFLLAFSGIIFDDQQPDKINNKVKQSFLTTKVLIIDECSMLTEENFYALFQALDMMHLERIILVGDPFQKRGDFRVRLKRVPGAEFLDRFALAEGGVDFSVADAVNQGFGFSAFAARHQVVLIHAGAGLEWPVTQRADGWSRRRDVA